MLSLANLFPNSPCTSSHHTGGWCNTEELQRETPVKTWRDKESGLIFQEQHDKTN